MIKLVKTIIFNSIQNILSKKRCISKIKFEFKTPHFQFPLRIHKPVILMS